jgi:hypothetical protein
MAVRFQLVIGGADPDAVVMPRRRSEVAGSRP